MIDYAKVAETLKELKEFYTQPLTPDLECWRVHRALAAAAALCEAHAAPVDEAKERAEFEVWYRERFWNVNLARDERGYHKGFVEDDWQVWLARARSDARAKVAEQWQPIETAPKGGTYFIAYSDKSVTITHHLIHWSTDFLEQNEAWRDAGGYEYDYLTHWQPLPPPPTIEGDGG